MTIRWLLAGLLAVTLGLSGCSDDADCQGSNYDVDLDSKGAGSPIAALEDWLGTDTDLADPPDEDWILVDPDEKADRAVLRNDTGDGWWVAVRKTSQDGWVVTQATDDATGCGDELSG